MYEAELRDLNKKKKRVPNMQLIFFLAGNFFFHFFFRVCVCGGEGGERNTSLWLRISEVVFRYCTTIVILLKIMLHGSKECFILSPASQKRRKNKLVSKFL